MDDEGKPRVKFEKVENLKGSSRLSTYYNLKHREGAKNADGDLIPVNHAVSVTSDSQSFTEVNWSNAVAFNASAAQPDDEFPGLTASAVRLTYPSTVQATDLPKRCRVLGLSARVGGRVETAPLNQHGFWVQPAAGRGAYFARDGSKVVYQPVLTSTTADYVLDETSGEVWAAATGQQINLSAVPESELLVSRSGFWHALTCEVFKIKKEGDVNIHEHQDCSQPQLSSFELKWFRPEEVPGLGAADKVPEGTGWIAELGLHSNQVVSKFSSFIVDYGLGQDGQPSTAAYPLPATVQLVEATRRAYGPDEFATRQLRNSKTKTTFVVTFDQTAGKELYRTSAGGWVEREVSSTSPIYAGEAEVVGLLAPTKKPRVWPSVFISGLLLEKKKVLESRPGFEKTLFSWETGEVKKTWETEEELESYLTDNTIILQRTKAWVPLFYPSTCDSGYIQRMKEYDRGKPVEDRLFPRFQKICETNGSKSNDVPLMLPRQPGQSAADFEEKTQAYNTIVARYIKSMKDKYTAGGEARPPGQLTTVTELNEISNALGMLRVELRAAGVPLDDNGAKHVHRYPVTSTDPNSGVETTTTRLNYTNLAYNEAGLTIPITTQGGTAQAFFQTAAASGVDLSRCMDKVAAESSDNFYDMMDTFNKTLSNNKCTYKQEFDTYVSKYTEGDTVMGDMFGGSWWKSGDVLDRDVYLENFTFDGCEALSMQAGINKTNISSSSCNVSSSVLYTQTTNTQTVRVNAGKLTKDGACCGPIDVQVDATQKVSSLDLISFQTEQKATNEAVVTSAMNLESERFEKRKITQKGTGVEAIRAGLAPMQQSLLPTPGGKTAQGILNDATINANFLNLYSLEATLETVNAQAVNIEIGDYECTQEPISYVDPNKMAAVRALGVTDSQALLAASKVSLGCVNDPNLPSLKILAKATQDLKLTRIFNSVLEQAAENKARADQSGGIKSSDTTISDISQDFSSGLGEAGSGGLLAAVIISAVLILAGVIKRRQKLRKQQEIMDMLTYSRGTGATEDAGELPGKYYKTKINFALAPRLKQTDSSSGTADATHIKLRKEMFESQLTSSNDFADKHRENVRAQYQNKLKSEDEQGTYNRSKAFWNFFWTLYPDGNLTFTKKTPPAYPLWVLPSIGVTVGAVLLIQQEVSRLEKELEERRREKESRDDLFEEGVGFLKDTAEDVVDTATGVLGLLTGGFFLNLIIGIAVSVLVTVLTYLLIVALDPNNLSWGYTFITLANIGVACAIFTQITGAFASLGRNAILTIDKVMLYVEYGILGICCLFFFGLIILRWTITGGPIKEFRRSQNRKQTQTSPQTNNLPTPPPPSLDRGF